MTRKDDLTLAVDLIALAKFDTRVGTTVPTTDTVKLTNGGVYLDAVYLYADMADSTGMAQSFNEIDAAKIVRAYLSAVTRVIKYRDGEIRSYDGDRVMAIFVGADAATRAVKAALEIKWVVDNIVHEELDLLVEAYEGSPWNLSHHTGVDIGEAFIVRAGVRNSNDLISIGDAPNIAAKLSEEKYGRTMITERVWDAMGVEVCYSSKESKAMWSLSASRRVGSRVEEVRYSNWGWIVN